MLKTVKVKKQMHLDELIKYIFDNGIEDKTYGVTVFNNTSEVRVSSAGNINMSGFNNKYTKYTVEVEEEITEDTVFEDVVRVTREKEITQDKNMSINDCLDWKDYQVQIFAMLDGKLQLIWEEN